MLGKQTLCQLSHSRSGGSGPVPCAREVTRGVQELDQLVRVARLPGRGSIGAMFASLLYLVLLRLLTLVAPSYRSEAAAQIEILVLRHQLAVLRRQVKRPVYRRCDRVLLAAASRILPRERWGTFLVRPETLLRDPSRRVPGLAADPRAPPSRSRPSRLCAALQPATPASRPEASGTGEHSADRRGDGVPAIERRDLLGGLLHEYIRAA
jgi:hypothetical protein